jgi:serine/threonine protein kinase
MSPEQLHGDPLDARSNIFSLGAILYEMVTERKAFDGEDADQVRTRILEQMPVAPIHVKAKVHPALNNVIMKALAKAPEERYQSGQELVNDLEKCKESASKSASATAAPQVKARQAQNPTAAYSKPIVPARTSTLARSRPVVSQKDSKPAVTAAKAPEAVRPHQTAPPPQVSSTQPPPQAKAAAAAAGWGGPSTDLSRRPTLDPTAQFVSSCVKASVDAVSEPQANMSAAVAEPEVEAPKIAVDPMMDESCIEAAKWRLHHQFPTRR